MFLLSIIKSIKGDETEEGNNCSALSFRSNSIPVLCRIVVFRKAVSSPHLHCKLKKKLSIFLAQQPVEMN